MHYVNCIFLITVISCVICKYVRTSFYWSTSDCTALFCRYCTVILKYHICLLFGKITHISTFLIQHKSKKNTFFMKFPANKHRTYHNELDAVVKFSIYKWTWMVCETLPLFILLGPPAVDWAPGWRGGGWSHANVDIRQFLW